MHATLESKGTTAAAATDWRPDCHQPRLMPARLVEPDRCGDICSVSVNVPEQEDAPNLRRTYEPHKAERSP